MNATHLALKNDFRRSDLGDEALPAQGVVTVEQLSALYGVVVVLSSEDSSDPLVLCWMPCDSLVELPQLSDQLVDFVTLDVLARELVDHFFLGLWGHEAGGYL